MAVIDFWYSIGSTYTYLSVMRLDDVTRSTGAALVVNRFEPVKAS